MAGEDIICFAKDWDDDPTSNTHVMQLLSHNNRVVWLNSIAMRTPNLSSSRDMGRIVRRLRAALRGARQVDKNLWVLNPLVLPLPHSHVAVALNRLILRITLGCVKWRLGMRKFQLWTFLPSGLEYIGTLGESLAVYYCVDNWLHAKGFDGTRLRAMENRLSGRADLVFATAKSLEVLLRAANPETHLARHGVDHVHFAKALLPDTRLAPELDGIKRPILGVIAAIDERVDLALLGELAIANPQWSIVVVGRTTVDVSELEKYSNITFIGRKPYDRLPEFCKGFSVGLIPFLVNEYTNHVNPIKLREYLSAGLPVVSTNLPEVRVYKDLCYVTSTHVEFIERVRVAVDDNSGEARIRRSRAMLRETWEQKVADLGRHVMRVKQLKGRSN